MTKLYKEFYKYYYLITIILNAVDTSDSEIEKYYFAGLVSEQKSEMEKT